MEGYFCQNNQDNLTYTINGGYFEKINFCTAHEAQFSKIKKKEAKGTKLERTERGREERRLSMSSTPKRRTKFKHNLNSDVASKRDSYGSSSAVLLNSVKGPPRDFFPSKDDLTRLITVLFIAGLVFVSCNFFVSRLETRRPRPFCDSDADSFDLLSGKS